MTTPKHHESGVPSRRDFLKTVVVTGGAAALGAGTALADIRDEQQPGVSSEEAGYRATRHIRDYYARANF